MPLQRLRRRFGHHAKPLGHLFGSAGVAVFLPLLTAPINSRLYNPADFGLFALVIAISGVMVIPYVAGFSRVITLAESDEHAHTAFRGLASSLALPTAALGLGSVFAVSFGIRPFEIAFLSVVTFMLSAFSALCTQWLVFASKFKALAAARIIQVLVAAAVSIGLGLAQIGEFGLLIGHLSGLLAASYLLFRQSPSFTPSLRKAFGQLKYAVVTNRDLFATSMPAEGLNTVTHTLPTFLLTAYTGPAFLGLFNMANRLLELPASLVSSAAGQYFQAMAVRRNLSGQSLLPLVLAYSITLFLLALPFFVVGVIFAPDLASWALGEKWRTAGELSRYLSVYILLRIVVSPVTFVIFLKRAFMVSLVMDIALVTAIGIGLFVCLAVLKNSTLAVIYFSAVYSLSYLVSFWLSCTYARPKTPRDPSKVEADSAS